MRSGPAKGYLSDLELKLHQMEALIGVLLASQDPRASSLIADVSRDSVAREILNRVDTSLLGTHPMDQPGSLDPRVGNSSVGKRISNELADSTHEWQRHLSQIISRNSPLGGGPASKYPFSRKAIALCSRRPNRFYCSDRPDESFPIFYISDDRIVCWQLTSPTHR